MTTKEIIANLHQTFNSLMNPVTPVALIDATLMDGTPIQVTELAVGGIVTINGTPAPVGEHQLSDGTYIVVGDNGAIVEIKTETPQVMPEDMKKKMGMDEQFSAFEISTNEKFASYESKFASYENKFAEYESKLAKSMQFIEQLINVTKSLSETPTGKVDEVVKTTNNFKEEKKTNYDILFS